MDQNPQMQTDALDQDGCELIVVNTRAGLVAAHKRGRRGGRPPSMTEDKIHNAESMIKDTANYPLLSSKTLKRKHLRRMA